MFNDYVEMLTRLADRRFLLAAWTSVVLAAAGVVGIAMIAYGPERVVRVWTMLDAVGQILGGIALLVLVTAAAYVLNALALPIIRLYEGYWPDAFARLERPFVAHHERRRARRQEQGSGWLDEYPSDTPLPTRLGNIIRAAEQYSGRTYEANAIVWWPRLVAVLPSSFHTQAEAAFTPMQALLNLSIISLILGLAAAAVLSAEGMYAWAVLALILGPTLFYLLYRGALAPASEFAALIRAAFDLHRHRVLVAMRISLPSNLRKERELWTSLTCCVQRGIAPWLQETGPPDYDYVDASRTAKDDADMEPIHS